LILAIILIASATAVGDISQPQFSRTPTVPSAAFEPTVAGLGAQRASEVRVEIACDPWRGDLPHDGSLSLWQLSKYEAADGCVIRELPPLPSSFRLFLSGLVSAGALQLLRVGRNVRLGDAPAWLAPNEPLQIGHSVAVDSIAGAAPTALCLLDVPIVEPRHCALLSGRESPNRAPRQRAIPPVRPRGPPMLLS
jgi:hypothetical protein